MQLDDILSEWRKDAEIDRTELGEEALKIPQLHSKYYNIYSKERLQLRRLESELKVLQKLKYEYYGGTLDYEELKEQGWEPNNLKILRADIPGIVTA